MFLYKLLIPPLAKGSPMGATGLQTAPASFKTFPLLWCALRNPLHIMLHISLKFGLLWVSSLVFMSLP